MKITFFKSPSELHEWLKQHHDQARENYGLGFIKRARANPASPGRNRWMKRFALAGSMGFEKALMTSAIPFALLLENRAAFGAPSTSNTRRSSPKWDGCTPRVSKHFRIVTKSGRVYIPSNKRASSSMASMKRNCGRTKKPGISFKPRRPGINGLPVGG